MLFFSFNANFIVSCNFTILGGVSITFAAKKYTFKVADLAQGCFIFK